MSDRIKVRGDVFPSDFIEGGGEGRPRGGTGTKRRRIVRELRVFPRRESIFRIFVMCRYRAREYILKYVQRSLSHTAHARVNAYKKKTNTRTRGHKSIIGVIFLSLPLSEREKRYLLSRYFTSVSDAKIFLLHIDFASSPFFFILLQQR